MTQATVFAAPPGHNSKFAALWSRTPGWAGPVGVLGCIGAALGYTVLTNPVDSGADAIPTCLLKLTTGLDCPGCGGTRAAWYLMHGDLGGAARHHLGFVFAVPFLIYLYAAWALKTAFGWNIPQLRLSPKAIAWFLGGWAMFMVLRNLPWEPFTLFYI